MTTAADMAARWKAINPMELVKSALGESSDDIVQLNRDQMDEFGIDARDKDIRPEYSRTTIAYKLEKGQTSSFVTLHDTGEFHSKMYLKIQGDSFNIDSSDVKRNALVGKYGDHIFGLTDENKRVAWLELLQPKVIGAIKRLTGVI